MLDLKKLEAKLELVLASESSESLTTWLQEKRLRSYLQSLGDGSFSVIRKICSQTTITNRKSHFETTFNSVPFPENYLIAA